MKINYDQNIQPEQKADIEHYLNPFIWLIPKWCQVVEIIRCNDDTDAALATNVNYEYRNCVLYVYPTWYIQSREKKQDDIIHELIHFNINELYNSTKDAIRVLTDDEKTRELLFDSMTKHLESATQDLAFSIGRQFENLSGAVNVKPDAVAKYTNGEAVESSK